jgi:signal transduction histidine kinase
MRRRLATAILLTVLGVLVLGGIAVYMGARSILISDLDSLLYARASSLPELMHPAGFDPARVPVYDWHDRYRIQRDSASIIPEVPTAAPRLLGATFTTDPDGRRWRTVTVSAVAPSADQPRRQTVTVEYSGTTERIDVLLRKIALALICFGLLAGAITAAVALWVSNLVLRPLASTAQWLRGIDERNLDARVSLSQLPSELLPVSDRLNEMLTRLELAFEGQKQFLAHAAHELRAPVASLEKLLASADSANAGNESHAQAIGQSRAQVAVLRALVDRLSEYISDARRAAHVPEPVDVVAVMDECVDAATALGQPRHVRIARHGPSRLRCVLPVGRLRSIVANLLSNAVEHNRTGGTVDLTFLHDGRQLHVRVSDDGPGVAAEHVSKLFEPFYRIDDKPGQTTGHLGLGLFIVQSHVKAMNGSARVDSRTGVGTSVDIEIPCEPLATEGLADVPSQIAN